MSVNHTIHCILCMDAQIHIILVSYTYIELLLYSAVKLPVITKNPTNTSFTVNLDNNSTNVSITCEAAGASSYYWERQNGSIPSRAIGVNTSNLTIVNLQLEDAGYYRCVAINDIGSIESKYAELTLTGKAKVDNTLAISQSYCSCQITVTSNVATTYEYSYYIKLL